MHDSVLRWFTSSAISTIDIAGRDVLEVGSYNVNGSVRPILLGHEPRSYLGVDASAGPDVDQIVDCEHLEATFGADAFDVIVSTEMLEHAAKWRDCLWNMAAVLKPGGLLILTTRSPGFPFHPFPEDHWRYTVPLMSKALTACGLGSHKITDDPDPASPGVFVKTRKSDPWRPDWDALAELEAEPV